MRLRLLTEKCCVQVQRRSSTARWFIAVPPKRNGAQKLRAALKLTADSKPSRRRRDHLGDRRR
jgi:hypothetical protein